MSVYFVFLTKTKNLDKSSDKLSHSFSMINVSICGDPDFCQNDLKIDIHRDGSTGGGSGGCAPPQIGSEGVYAPPEFEIRTIQV